MMAIEYITVGSNSYEKEKTFKYLDSSLASSESYTGLTFGFTQEVVYVLQVGVVATVPHVFWQLLLPAT